MDNNEVKQTERMEQIEEIVQLGATKIENCHGKFHSLTIIGQIEGHVILPPQTKTTKYEHVLPQLVAIEEDDSIDGVLIILNTIGGDVEAGLAISEMIATMTKPTVSLVLGGGHSIGVPLAVAAKYSYIAPTATMTIHPIRMNGVVIGSAQTFQYFDRMQERVVQFIASNSNISKEKLKELMLKVGEMSNDVGSVLFGNDAVKCGIIDSLGGISDAMGKLRELKELQKEQSDND